MPDELSIQDTPLLIEDRPIIEQVLANLRPRLQADGGDVELVSAEGNTVVVRLQGACRGCVISGVTLGGIRRLLMHTLGKALRVIPALD
jgi:NifU-like protein